MELMNYEILYIDQWLRDKINTCNLSRSDISVILDFTDDEQENRNYELNVEVNFKSNVLDRECDIVLESKIDLNNADFDNIDDLCFLILSDIQNQLLDLFFNYESMGRWGAR